MSNEAVVNLKEYIRIDAIEGLLNSYHQRLTSHELKISSLETICDQLLSIHTFQTHQQSIIEKINELNSKLELLSSLTSVDVNGTRMSIKHVVEDQMIRVRSLETLYPTLASTSELNVSITQVKFELEKELQSLKENTAPLELADNLTVRAINEQLNINVLMSSSVSIESPS
jgi:hypothetical protein